MLALATPFECYTITNMKERVWGGMEKRPQIHESWSATVKLLLQRGWAGDLQQRFTMDQVEEILRKECIRIRDGDDKGLEHQRRRSTFVFRGSKTGQQGGSLSKEFQVTPPSRASTLQKPTTNKQGSIQSLSGHVQSTDCDC